MSGLASSPAYRVCFSHLKQIEEANKRLWSLLAEKTRAGIKMVGDGRPCDKVFEACLESAAVLLFMQPLPVAVSSEPPQKRARQEETKGSSKGGGKVPHALLALGCDAKNIKGIALCFNYNLKRCQIKGKCGKGLRVCAVKGCCQQHPSILVMAFAWCVGALRKFCQRPRL